MRRFYLREEKGILEIVILPDSFLQGKTQYWFKLNAQLIFDEVKRLHEVCVYEALLYNNNILVNRILIGDGCFAYYEGGQLKEIDYETLKQIEYLVAKDWFPFLERKKK